MGLTPVRTIYFEGMNAEVGEFDQDHMCLDFGELRKWMDDNNVVVKNHGQRVDDGRINLLGYPDNVKELQG